MKIDHIGIAVKSLDAAVKVYEQAIGLKPAGREEVVEQGVRLAMLEIGESRVELLEPTRPDSPIERFIAKRGEGLHHIAVQVEDIAAALARLKAAGVRLIDDTPKRGAHDTRIAFVHP